MFTSPAVATENPKLSPVSSPVAVQLGEVARGSIVRGYTALAASTTTLTHSSSPSAKEGTSKCASSHRPVASYTCNSLYRTAGTPDPGTAKSIRCLSRLSAGIRFPLTIRSISSTSPGDCHSPPPLTSDPTTGLSIVNPCSSPRASFTYHSTIPDGYRYSTRFPFAFSLGAETTVFALPAYP